MIKEAENELFREWKEIVERESDAVFVTDGVVNEEVWLKSEIKVLYLLKEGYGGDQSWDERDYLANYNTKEEYIRTHSRSIDELIRWQFGISNGMNFSWEQVKELTAKKSVQSDMLSSICVVNLKKVAGGATVDWNVFDKYFANPINRNNLSMQLELYKPSIVVCGGTAWHLCIIKGWNYDDWKQTHRGVKYYIDNETVYIDLCHPNNRGPKNMIYYALLDALEECGKLGTVCDM